MDHNSTDASGDAPGLPESPPMSRSMVVREIKQVVEVLKELRSTPLIDTCQISLGDLSISGSESEGDADRVARCVLFQSPEQPTKTQLTSTQDSEEWLISLASPVPVAGTKDGVAPASTEPGAALQGIKLEAAGASGGWLDLLSLGETKRDSSKQPSTVEAGGDRLRAATTGSLDELLTVLCEEVGTANSRTSHEDLAMASGETTCAIPAVPAAPSLAAVPKKGTYNMAVADTTVTLGHSTVVHRPAEQFDSTIPGWSVAATQESLDAQEEAAAVNQCVIEEDLAVANADATFTIPSMPAAPKKGTSDTGAVGTTVTLGQGTLAHRPAEQSNSTMPGSSLAAIQEPSREEAATVGPCASEEGLAEANVETTFVISTLPTAPSTAALPRKAPSATTGAADTTVTLRGPVGLRKRTPGQPLPPRRSMLPPPLQRAGRLTVPSGPTMARGRPRVGPAAAADATFGMSKTRAPEGRLSAPKNALQAKQAGAASKPVSGMPGPKVIPPLRQPVARSLGRATAAPRLSLQAPAVSAQVDGAAQQGPPTRPSMVPGAAAAATRRSSLRPRPRPAATATGGSLPRPAASSGASSNRAPPRLLPVVESPEPTRVSSTPVRSGAPMCDGPDLTPIRKEH